MFTLQFWKDALERAIATFAQALVATGLIVDGVGLWELILAALAAAALSVLKSMAVVNVGEANNASVVSYDYLPTKPEPDGPDDEDDENFFDESYSESETIAEPVTLENGEVEYGSADSK